MGDYIGYTRRAAVSVTAAVILSVIPYFLLYQIIAPLIEGEQLSAGYVILRVLLTTICLSGNAILYVHGLELSHISAYNTLKNLRIALQEKLEKQPCKEFKFGRMFSHAADLNLSESSGTYCNNTIIKQSPVLTGDCECLLYRTDQDFFLSVFLDSSGIIVESFARAAS